MIRSSIIAFFATIVCFAGYTQTPTIGLLSYDEARVSEGLVLFTPWNSGTTYLINTCGQLVHEWYSEPMSDQKVAYLDKEGNLVRLTEGQLEMRSWENDIIWSINGIELGIDFHHDFELLDNGNILIIGSETLASANAIELGRDSVLLNQEDMMFDGVYELKINASGSYDIVWKWSFLDHLVQDRDSSKSNFAAIIDRPRRLDINFPFQGNNPNIDWAHCNGIDYNHNLDQILLSCRNSNEIYILDHSTSTEEAADSVGGLSGFGGDFLWRWGRPSNYGHQDFENIFTGQHDPNWIPQGHPNAGMISVFNNTYQSLLDSMPYSSVHILNPLEGGNASYTIYDNNQFGPLEYEWSFLGEWYDFFSPIMSGAQSQENGNFSICLGRTGSFYEVDRDGNIVWSYQNPVFTEPMNQFINPTFSFVFNIEKYSYDFQGFEGKDLSPTDPIETINSLSDICLSVTSVDKFEVTDPQIFPNPSQGIVHFSHKNKIDQVSFYSPAGKLILHVESPEELIDISNYNGMCFVRIESGQDVWIQKIVITK